MIDKPEEGKTPKPKKTTKPKPEAKPIEKAEDPKAISPKKAEVEPNETLATEELLETITPTEPTPEKAEVIAPEEPQPKTLDEQLLEIYNDAAPGNMSLGQIMVQTGIDDPMLIKQAWDRLYDLRKVPFSKLFKPRKGYIGIE